MFREELFPYIEETPCRNCTERFAECHSTCRRYKIWRLRRDRALAKIRKKKEAEALPHKPPKKTRR